MARRRRKGSSGRSSARKTVILKRRDDCDPGVPVLTYATFPSGIGRLLLIRSDEGLRAVRFGRSLDVEAELGRQTAGERAVAVEDALKLQRVADSIAAYLEGRKPRFDYRLDLGGVSDFGRAVLEVVSNIPYGTLRSYKWVADRIGHPRATRPVGQALSRNPLPIIIPCHRVVQSDGTLGGYSGGGPDMKRRLIEIETGQTGLVLEPQSRESRRHIRFLLDSES